MLPNSFLFSVPQSSQKTTCRLVLWLNIDTSLKSSPCLIILRGIITVYQAQIVVAT